MIQYVAGFLFTEDHQKVVLIKKNKPTWQAGLWNGVGGKRDGDEPWEDSMSREFQEESGVFIHPTLWQHTVTLFNEGFECRFFRAFSTKDALNTKTMEAEKVALHHMQDVSCGSVPVINNLYWLLPLQLDRGLGFPIAPIRDGLPMGTPPKV